MSTTPFNVIPELTTIAIAFRNPAWSLIADEVMPRAGQRLTKKEFKYSVFNLADGYTVPDTAVGRLGRPNQVVWSAQEKDGSVKDYGLEEPVPLDDINQAKGTPYDPRNDATEFVTGLIQLDRECRVASIVQDPANYAGNVLTLSGSDKFSDPGSDPVGVITDALDTPIVRPNCMTMGKRAWTKLRTHPKIVQAIYPVTGGNGVVSRQQFCELFEIGKLCVGESFVNTAKRGQAANLQRTWGPHIGMHFIDPTASNNRGITWGLTLQYGDKVAGTRPDGTIGLRGGEQVRVGESVAELVTAPEVGFLILNAA